MTKPTRSSAARCDRIISLIDECLAELDAGLRVIAGEGRTGPTTFPVPTEHLALVRSQPC
jgi:hypothetical protein